MTRTLALFSLSVLICGTLQAEDSWSRIKGLSTNSAVRIRLFDGTEHKGELQSSDPDWIRLVDHGNEIKANRADVARVEVRQSSRRVRSVLIGAAIGTAVGIVAAVATCPSCVGEQSNDDFNARLAGGAFAGAGIGAALGLAGSPYKTIYKSKRQKSNP
jgi:hypothetical protein